MLRLRTLGAVDLQGADGEELLTVLAQPKRLGLLAYLALTAPQGWQRRDRLMSLFWPELDVEHARNALSQALFFLRRHLGAETILARNSEDVGIAPDALWCDATAFDDAVNANRFMEAVELYRGELLSSFHVPDGAAELERWIDNERHRLARQYARALETLAEECEESGDFAAAVVWWRRLASHDRHDGRVALRLMRALAAADDRAGALEYARIYTLILREELESNPDPRVTAYANELRDGPSTFVVRPPAERDHEEQSLGEPFPAPSPNEPLSARATPRLRWRRVPTAIRIVFTLVVLAMLTLVYRARTSNADVVIRSIAVIPFDNLTNDPNREYLADIATDQLITELARYKELYITSRMSVLKYKGAKPSAAKIAHDLHVDAFVEGTLAGDGRTIQITAQLIKAPNDRHLWAERYVRDSANVLAVEADIASAIARAVNLQAAPAPRLARIERTDNAVSYSLYLRGQSAMLQRTPAAMREARTYFATSVRQDSDYAPGYAGLSEAYLISGIDGFTSLRLARDSALAFANKAVRLDSLLPEAHTALAGVYGDAGKMREAEVEFKRALELGPRDALAYHWYAQLLLIQDRLPEAYEQVKRGREIDPSSASLARTAAPIERALGISKPSSARAATAVLRDPLHAWSRATYANRLALEGKCAEARANIDTSQAMIPDNIRMEVTVFAVEYRCGDRAKAARLFARLKKRPDARARGLWIAAIYKKLGQTDSAFAWLDSVDWNGDLRFNFRADSSWDNVKKDPRYTRTLRQMGLQ